MTTTAAVPGIGKRCHLPVSLPVGRRAVTAILLTALTGAGTATVHGQETAPLSPGHVSPVSQSNLVYFSPSADYQSLGNASDRWVIHYDWAFEDKGSLGVSLASEQSVEPLLLQPLAISANIVANRTDYGAAGTEDFRLFNHSDPEFINLTTRYSVGGFNATLVLNKYRGLDTDSEYLSLDKNLVTDLELNYGFANGLTLTLGGNNIFDRLPKSSVSPSDGADEFSMDPDTGDLQLRTVPQSSSTPLLFPLGTEGTYYYFKATYEF